MTKRPTTLPVFWGGLLLFLAVFGLSVLLQSPILLYIASAIPMFVVPFLPDLKLRQTLKPTADGIDIAMTDCGGDPEAEMLIVAFPPGRVHWNRKLVYVSLDRIRTVPSAVREEYTAAVTVLRHDLTFDSRHNRIGICLPNVLERLHGLPFTAGEVNRLLLRMEDVRDAIIPESMQSYTRKPNRRIDLDM